MAVPTLRPTYFPAVTLAKGQICIQGCQCSQGRSAWGINLYLMSSSGRLQSDRTDERATVVHVKTGIPQSSNLLCMFAPYFAVLEHWLDCGVFVNQWCLSCELDAHFFLHFCPPCMSTKHPGIEKILGWEQWALCCIGTMKRSLKNVASMFLYQISCNIESFVFLFKIKV